MKVKNGLHIGKIGSSFFAWGEDVHIELKAKNIVDAVKEAEKIIIKKKK